MIAATLIQALAGCASPPEDVIVVSTYDGPPPAKHLTETLSGSCEGQRTELRFIPPARDEISGRLELFVEGRRVADLSDTALGRDWTARSRILRKTMRCSRNFIRLAANGVEIDKDGLGRLVYSEASLTNGKLTSYRPPAENDVDYWRTFNR